LTAIEREETQDQPRKNKAQGRKRKRRKGAVQDERK